MDDVVTGFSALSNQALAAQITELAGHLNAANHRWLVLIAEFDRRQGWSDGFTKSCAHWLSWKCGLDLGAAREKVRVARALEQLPGISSSMSTGQLSYSKVRALTRVATPETEPVLLNVAVHGTTHHVEELVRKYRRVLEVGELSREARQQAHRGLTYQYDADGAVLIKLRLPAETGALFLRAIEAAMPEVSPAKAPTSGEASSRGAVPFPTAAWDSQDSRHVSPETPEISADARIRLESPTYSMRRADAAAVLAESFLAHGPAALKGGERQQIVVHVDEATLRARQTGRCELDDGPAIPVETARRLSCDASCVTIVESDQGEPLDVGRKTRTIPPALRRALNSRDQGCVFPGCTHKRYVDGHHIDHWADGGATKLSNLVSLCRFHHRAVHEGGLRIERCHDGAWRFIHRNGESIVGCAPGHTRPMTNWTVVVHENAARGVIIDARTGATRWSGEAMDYGIAVDSLLYRRRMAAKEASARFEDG